MTGDLFVAYVQRQLVPTLRPGDIVVRDNLSCPKRSEVRQAIERAGCQLRLLPPYRPDLNPIEQAFSKLKGKLRASAKRAVEELWKYLGEIIDEFGPGECRNYFHSCGYSNARSNREPLIP
jgi:transposase